MTTSIHNPHHLQRKQWVKVRERKTERERQITTRTMPLFAYSQREKEKERVQEQKQVIESKTKPLFDYSIHNPHRLHRKPCGKVGLQFLELVFNSLAEIIRL